MTGQDLKNSILQLAIQGKLVPQNPDDEPASVLLERIKAEKKKLIEEKKIKKEKPLPEITEDEMPFEIPDSWVWVRLGEIASFLNGDRSKNYPNKAEYVSEGIPWINTGHILANGFLSVDSMNYITENKYNSLSSGKIQKGDLVYCLRGATYGKVSRVEPFEKGAIASSLMIIRLFNLDLREYLYVYLKSKLSKDILLSYANGAAQPNLAAKDVAKFFLPLPPLSEQKRIVAKIEELMPLVDEYDKAQKELDSLNSAMPEQLKQSLLQEAIMGKLGTNNPDDEPASVLLQRIKEEKAQLIKDKKIKKEKPLPEITEDEIPFEIPDNWVWVRLGEIISIKSGDGLTSKEMQGGNIPVYGGNGVNGYHNNYNVDSPTVVIGRVGFYCGSVHVTPSKAWVTDNAFITSYPESYVFRDFLILTLRFMNLGKQHNATAQPVVSGKKIYPMLFPLPPLAEQHRIVSKIENLFACIEPLAKDVK